MSDAELGDVWEATELRRNLRKLDATFVHVRGSLIADWKVNELSPGSDEILAAAVSRQAAGIRATRAVGYVLPPELVEMIREVVSEMGHGGRDGNAEGGEDEEKNDIRAHAEDHQGGAHDHAAEEYGVDGDEDDENTQTGVFSTYSGSRNTLGKPGIIAEETMGESSICSL